MPFHGAECPCRPRDVSAPECHKDLATRRRRNVAQTWRRVPAGLSRIRIDRSSAQVSRIHVDMRSAFAAPAPATPALMVDEGRRCEPSTTLPELRCERFAPGASL